MRPVKTNGAAEVASFRKRVARAHALGRIGRPDLEYLDKLAAEIESRVISMVELDENGEEVGDA
jgi:hypothetical protein